MTARVCVCPRYKAPEMQLNKQYKYSVDWWNIGILLYFFMFGEHPFASAVRH